MFTGQPFFFLFFLNSFYFDSVISWILKKESSGGSWLLTLQVQVMSEGTEPPSGNLTSNWFKDRATWWTKFGYLLALTDLSRQLSGLKCRYGRATDKNKYRAVSDNEGRGDTGHTTRVQRKCTSPWSLGEPGERCKLPNIAHSTLASRFAWDIWYGNKTTQQYLGAVQPRPSQPISPATYWLIGLLEEKCFSLPVSVCIFSSNSWTPRRLED